MQNILFIFNLIPEDAKYFVIPVDHPSIPLLRRMHGMTINIDELTEEQERDSMALQAQMSDNPAYFENEYLGEVGILKNFEAHISDTTQPFEAVYIFNFYL